MKKNNGFALLDVLLAVVLLAIAAYGTFKVAKSFHSASSVQQFEQYALNIAHSYTPYIADTDSSLIDDSNKMETDFLQSIAIPSEALVSPGDANTYLYSGIYKDSSQCQVEFQEANEDTGAGYLIMAVKTTGAQYNQLLQDLGGSFSVFRLSGGSKALTSSASQGLLNIDNNATNEYSVFLVYPKSGSTPPSTGDLSPGSCSSS